MKPQAEWAVPIVIGVAFGLGLWALDLGGPDAGGDATDPSAAGTFTPEPPHPILLPFRDSLGPHGEKTTFVLLAPLGKSAALDSLNASSLGDQAATLSWQSPKVALTTMDNLLAGCHPQPDGTTLCSDPAWVFGAWPLPRPTSLPANGTGPRLLHDGYNATRVTAYVFDEAGLLLASNANDTARFTLHGDFIRLPSTAWYLGANKTAPPGTAHLPSLAKPLVDKVRPELDGLPVGGVASTRSNAYASLYGSLFVTVRVDALVWAP